jgi:hypothetical protein
MSQCTPMWHTKKDGQLQNKFSNWCFLYTNTEKCIFKDPTYHTNMCTRSATILKNFAYEFKLYN